MKWDFRLWLQQLIPTVLVSLLLVWIYQKQTEALVDFWGCHTRNIDKLYTAFTGPLCHGDSKHLIGNLLSFIGLSGLFVLVFPRDWWRFFWIQWGLSSVLLFGLGDFGEVHIGVSTWLYAYAAFLSVHVLRSKEKRMRALFLVLVLWYGGMWWGLLPILPGVSHEGHLAGLLTGLIIAFGALPYWDKRVLPEWHYTPKDWEGEEEPLNPYD